LGKATELTLKDGEDYGGVNPLEALENIKKRFREKKEGKKSLRKTALVLQGGGMRGVFGAGVCCALEELGYTKAFDEVYGVSAGALNAAYFLSGQAAYGTTIYYQDINNRKFIHFFRFKKIMDIDFLMEVIYHKKPLNLKRLLSNPTSFNVVLTRVSTGEAVIFKLEKAADIFSILKATCALPFAYDIPVDVGGEKYLDGGVSCPIPLKEAIEGGCTDIMVVFTRPKDYEPGRSKFSEILDYLLVEPRIKKHGQKFFEVYKKRESFYREIIHILKEKNSREKKANILCVFPGSSPKVKRVTKKKSLLKKALIEGAIKTLKLFGEENFYPAEVFKFLN